jgi:SAM-dependent methyltransferase
MTDTSRVVQERQYHDHFYEADSIRIAESHMYRALDERMIDLLIRRGSKPGARVLSVGSGDGRLEVRAASQLAELVGYELSPVAVERARARAAEAGSANAHFEVGEIGKLRLPAQSFDAVWAIAVLHHLDDEQIVDVLSWAHQILKPGGLLVSIDPSTRRLVGLFRRFVARTYEQHHSPEERELDISRVRQQFRDAGFERLESYPTDYFASPLAWIVPTIPQALVPGVILVDTMLMKIPVLREYASSFMVVGRKPE